MWRYHHQIIVLDYQPKPPLTPPLSFQSLSQFSSTISNHVFNFLLRVGNYPSVLESRDRKQKGKRINSLLHSLDGLKGQMVGRLGNSII